MTWASEIMTQSIEVRALVVAIMNTSSSLQWTWAPIVLWPVTGKFEAVENTFSDIKLFLHILVCLDAPRYGKQKFRPFHSQISFPATIRPDCS